MKYDVRFRDNIELNDKSRFHPELDREKEAIKFLILSITRTREEHLQ